MSNITTAIHAQQDNVNVVILDSLRVLITEDEDGWIAQGVEVDYFAGGESLEDVQRRFEIGLHKTAEEYIKRNGNIKSLLQWAPEDVILSLKKSEEFFLTTVGIISLDMGERFPFNSIKFLKRVAA